MRTDFLYLIASSSKTLSEFVSGYIKLVADESMIINYKPDWYSNGEWVDSDGNKLVTDTENFIAVVDDRLVAVIYQPQTTGGGHGEPRMTIHVPMIYDFLTLKQVGMKDIQVTVHKEQFDYADEPKKPKTNSSSIRTHGESYSRAGATYVGYSPSKGFIQNKCPHIIKDLRTWGQGKVRLINPQVAGLVRELYQGNIVLRGSLNKIHELQTMDSMALVRPQGYSTIRRYYHLDKLDRCTHNILFNKFRRIHDMEGCLMLAFNILEHEHLYYGDFLRAITDLYKVD